MLTIVIEISPLIIIILTLDFNMEMLTLALCIKGYANLNLYPHGLSKNDHAITNKINHVILIFMISY